MTEVGKRTMAHFDLFIISLFSVSAAAVAAAATAIAFTIRYFHQFSKISIVVCDFNLYVCMQVCMFVYARE